MSDPKEIHTWLKEFNPEERGNEALVDLWLENDDNQARVILKAFKIGVEAGKRLSNKTPVTGIPITETKP